MDKTFSLAVGVCYCLQTFNLDVNIAVMRLLPGQSLMVISTTGSILLYAKVRPLYNVLWKYIIVVYM